MKINVIGGGPGGLYTAALLKKADPGRDVRVYERNRPDDTFGFGVVFSDATLEEISGADPETYRLITERFYHWDDIHIHYKGRLLSSSGHGFAGMSRKELLGVLQARCRDVGVELFFETEITDLDPYLDADLVIGADGLNSRVRERFSEEFQPSIDERPNRFVWLGTDCPFPAFTFYFKESEAGLWRVHAYQYDEAGNSTFIVEAREETWKRAGLDTVSEAETVAFCEALFSEELKGHSLVRNRSVWRTFPTVRNAKWSAGHVVLIGDAVHTAHFSIGSGTRLAMLDGIALTEALAGVGAKGPGALRELVVSALEAYEGERRSGVESLQRAAQTSLQWFEDTERYMDLDPEQFGFALLTRSLRISHENLRERDPEFVDSVDEWVAGTSEVQSGRAISENETVLGVRSDEVGGRPPPPMFTPFRLRDLVLPNRVGVSAMCQYSSADGRPDDWHLTHIGSRAMGGAGLIMAEMSAVTRAARISHGCTGLYLPEHRDEWKRIVDFVHTHSFSKIGIQLGHAGRKASTQLAWNGSDQPLEEGAWDIVSASPMPFHPHSSVPAELSRQEMDQLVGDFAAAAQMARDASFDLVEIHMAHGYLLASFLSPLTNERTDEYGGPLENRLRFPLEVMDVVRDVWPDEAPVSVRISAVDWWPGGNGPEDAVEISRSLKAHGCDIVDVSAGQTVPFQRPVYGRQYQTPFSDRIRHEVGLATMAVGNISSFEDVNSIIAAGRADICLLARAHLWDPYWTRHAAFELGYPLSWPTPYESINRYTPRF